VPHNSQKLPTNYSKASCYPVHVSNITCYRLERKFKPSKIGLEICCTRLMLLQLCDLFYTALLSATLVGIVVTGWIFIVIVNIILYTQNHPCTSTFCIASFPGHSHLQYLIAYSMQIQRGKAWEIRSRAVTSGRQMVDTWGAVPTVVIPVSCRTVPGAVNDGWY